MAVRKGLNASLKTDEFRTETIPLAVRLATRMAQVAPWGEPLANWYDLRRLDVAMRQIEGSNGENDIETIGARVLAVSSFGFTSEKLGSRENHQTYMLVDSC